MQNMDTKLNDLIKSEHKVKKEEERIELGWRELNKKFLNRPYVSEFLKVYCNKLPNFIRLAFEPELDLVKILDISNEETEVVVIGHILPDELSRFLYDDEYAKTFPDKLEQQKTEEQKRLEQERKKKRYELYKKLKEEFEQ